MQVHRQLHREISEISDFLNLESIKMGNHTCYHINIQVNMPSKTCSLREPIKRTRDGKVKDTDQAMQDITPTVSIDITESDDDESDEESEEITMEQMLDILRQEIREKLNITFKESSSLEDIVRSEVKSQVEILAPIFVQSETKLALSRNKLKK